MVTGIVRTGIGVFLLAHGLMHAGLANTPLPQPGGLHTPFWPSWWRSAVDSSWLIARLGIDGGAVRTVGWVLWLAALAGYVLAGLGFLGVPGLREIWIPLTAGASVVSLLMLALYWHPWLVAAVLLDMALLAGALLRAPAAIFQS